MGLYSVRLPQKQIEHAKPKEKDYVLSDGDGLQLRIYIELCGRYLAFTRKAHLPTDSLLPYLSNYSSNDHCYLASY